MVDAAIVRGEIVAYKSTVDGGSRVTLELDELETAKFHESFRLKMLCALAGLEDGFTQASEGEGVSDPVGGDLQP